MIELGKIMHVLDKTKYTGYYDYFSVEPRKEGFRISRMFNQYDCEGKFNRSGFETSDISRDDMEKFILEFMQNGKHEQTFKSLNGFCSAVKRYEIPGDLYKVSSSEQSFGIDYSGKTLLKAELTDDELRITYRISLPNEPINLELIPEQDFRIVF